MDQTDPAPVTEQAAAPDQARPREPRPVRRHEGLGAARGLVNGIVFTLGLWFALTGLVVLIFFR